MKWSKWIAAGLVGMTLNWLAAGHLTSLMPSSQVSGSRATASTVAESVTEPIAQSSHQTSNQLPPLIDRQILFGNARINGATLSPNGEMMAFVQPFEGTKHIWVKGINEPFNAARPLTAGEQPVTGLVGWSADSQYVIYKQDKGGNENYHIYVVKPPLSVTLGDSIPTDDSIPESRDLTPLENIRASIISVPESRPNEILVALNDRDPRFHDAYRINLETGDRQLLFRNDGTISRKGWTADLQGNLRLAGRINQDGSTEILQIKDETLEPVYRCDPLESFGVMRFHADGARVYIMTNKGDDVDLARLVLLDLETQDVEVVDSDPENEVDFGSAIFSEDTEELIATVYVGDRQRIYPQTEAFAEDLEQLHQKLPEGNLSFSSATQDGQLWIVAVASDVDPGTAYLFNRETGEVERLYTSRPDLPTESLASMQPIRYTARDGTEIPAYLTLPAGVEPRQLPTVIYPHGGPWFRDTWEYDQDVQLLANRGYAVLQPNFRGSTGYGQDYLNAGNQEWGTGVMQHDITDGVQYLIDQGIADPERIAIYGISYGGYAALAGLAFTPDLYAAGVSYVGISNLISLLNNQAPYTALAERIVDIRIGDPDNPQDRQRMRRQSPLFHVDQIDDPLLVIQGANDPRVPKAESDQIVSALNDAGKEVTYLLAPNEGHGFVRETNKLAVAAALEEFLAKHIGGRYQEDMEPQIRQRLESLTVDVDQVTAEVQ